MVAPATPSTSFLTRLNQGAKEVNQTTRQAEVRTDIRNLHSPHLTPMKKATAQRSPCAQTDANGPSKRTITTLFSLQATTVTLTHRPQQQVENVVCHAGCQPGMKGHSASVTATCEFLGHSADPTLTAQCTVHCSQSKSAKRGHLMLSRPRLLLPRPAHHHNHCRSWALLQVPHHRLQLRHHHSHTTSPEAHRFHTQSTSFLPHPLPHRRNSTKST